MGSSQYSDHHFLPTHIYKYRELLQVSERLCSPKLCLHIIIPKKYFSFVFATAVQFRYIVQQDGKESYCNQIMNESLNMSQNN